MIVKIMNNQIQAAPQLLKDGCAWKATEVKVVEAGQQPNNFKSILLFREEMEMKEKTMIAASSPVPSWLNKFHTFSSVEDQMTSSFMECDANDDEQELGSSINNATEEVDELSVQTLSCLWFKFLFKFSRHRFALRIGSLNVRIGCWRLKRIISPHR